MDQEGLFVGDLTNLEPTLKFHHLQQLVVHYNTGIYPFVTAITK